MLITVMYPLANNSCSLIQLCWCSFVSEQIKHFNALDNSGTIKDIEHQRVLESK